MFRASFFKMFNDVNSQNSPVPLRLHEVCSSSVFSGSAADIFFTFALKIELKQPFLKTN